MTGRKKSNKYTDFFTHFCRQRKWWFCWWSTDNSTWHNRSICLHSNIWSILRFSHHGCEDVIWSKMGEASSSGERSHNATDEKHQWWGQRKLGHCNNPPWDWLWNKQLVSASNYISNGGKRQKSWVRFEGRVFLKLRQYRVWHNISKSRTRKLILLFSFVRLLLPV